MPERVGHPVDSRMGLARSLGRHMLSARLNQDSCGQRGRTQLSNQPEEQLWVLEYGLSGAKHQSHSAEFSEDLKKHPQALGVGITSQRG